MTVKPEDMPKEHEPKSNKDKPAKKSHPKTFAVNVENGGAVAGPWPDLKDALDFDPLTDQGGLYAATGDKLIIVGDSDATGEQRTLYRWHLAAHKWIKEGD